MLIILSCYFTSAVLLDLVGSCYEAHYFQGQNLNADDDDKVQGVSFF